MDLLGEVLLSLKIGTNSVGIFHCGAPWGMDVPSMTQANAYMFCEIDSPFWLMLENQQPHLLEPGDAALILHGPRYSFASSPKAPCVALERTGNRSISPGSPRAPDRTLHYTA